MVSSARRSSRPLGARSGSSSAQPVAYAPESDSQEHGTSRVSAQPDTRLHQLSGRERQTGFFEQSYPGFSHDTQNLASEVRRIFHSSNGGYDQVSAALGRLTRGLNWANASRSARQAERVDNDARISALYLPTAHEYMRRDQYVEAAYILRDMLTFSGKRSSEDLPVEEKRQEGLDGMVPSSNRANEHTPSQVTKTANAVLVKLCSGHEQRTFLSHHEARATRILWRALRASGIRRTERVYALYVRALLESDRLDAGVAVFVEQVHAWWREQERLGALFKRASEGSEEKNEGLRNRYLGYIPIEGSVPRPSNRILKVIRSSMKRSLAAAAELQHHVHGQAEARRHIKAYARTLEMLGTLLASSKLPLPPSASANSGDLAWLISSLYEFEQYELASAARIVAGDDHEQLLKRVTVANREVMRLLISNLKDDGVHGSHSQSPLSQGPPDPDTGTSIPTDTALPGGSRRRRARRRAVAPALSRTTYNALMHYSMRHLRSPELCWVVFKHMTELRQPPLRPDDVTLNILLRQATLLRHAPLASAALEMRASEADRVEGQSAQDDCEKDPTGPQRRTRSAHSDTESDAIHTGGRKAARKTEVETDTVAASSGRESCMAFQIDAALNRSDTYHLTAAIWYFTVRGGWLDECQPKKGFMSVDEIVFRLYPNLDLRRHRRARLSALSKSFEKDERDSQRADDHQPHARSLPLETTSASFHPHVLTAVLNLAAKAGRTGLAERVWRLLKRASHRSWRMLASDDPAAASRGWYIPVEAATIMMQLYAREGRKGMPTHRTRSSHQLAPCAAVVRPSARRGNADGGSSRKCFVRGWAGQLLVQSRRNLAFGTPRRVRWKAARRAAQMEYDSLLAHWTLDPYADAGSLGDVDCFSATDSPETASVAPLSETSAQGDPAASSASEGNARSTPLLKSRTTRPVRPPVPDQRFYNPLLDLFGRRRGMRARSARHLGASYWKNRQELLTQEQEKQLARHDRYDDGAESGREEGQGYGEEDDSADGHAYRTSQDSDAQISPSAAERSLPRLLDPFVITLVHDMHAYGLEVPAAFRHLLFEKAPGYEIGDIDSSMSPWMVEHDAKFSGYAPLKESLDQGHPVFGPATQLGQSSSALPPAVPLRFDPFTTPVPKQRGRPVRRKPAPGWIEAGRMLKRSRARARQQRGTRDAAKDGGAVHGTVGKGCEA